MIEDLMLVAALAAGILLIAAALGLTLDERAADASPFGPIVGVSEQERRP